MGQGEKSSLHQISQESFCLKMFNFQTHTHKENTMENITSVTKESEQLLRLRSLDVYHWVLKITLLSMVGTPIHWNNIKPEKLY